MPDPLDPPALPVPDPLNPLAGGGAAAALLTDTCRVGRKTATDDGQGTSSDVWAQVATGIHCRLFQPTNDKEVVQGGVLSAITAFRLQLPLGTDLRPADQVDKAGDVYEVIDTDKGLSFAVYLTAFLSRVRNQKLEW